MKLSQGETSALVDLPETHLRPQLRIQKDENKTDAPPPSARRKSSCLAETSATPHPLQPHSGGLEWRCITKTTHLRLQAGILNKDCHRPDCPAAGHATCHTESGGRMPLAAGLGRMI